MGKRPDGEGWYKYVGMHPWMGDYPVSEPVYVCEKIYPNDSNREVFIWYVCMINDVNQCHVSEFDGDFYPLDEILDGIG